MLLIEFDVFIGVLVFVNMLFNMCGELIVCLLCDVIECFWMLLFDVFVIGLFLLEKLR